MIQRTFRTCFNDCEVPKALLAWALAAGSLGALKISKIQITTRVPGHYRMGNHSKSTGVLAPVAPVPGMHIEIFYFESTLSRFKLWKIFRPLFNAALINTLLTNTFVFDNKFESGQNATLSQFLAFEANRTCINFTQ